MVYSFGPFVLDRSRRTLLRDGEVVPLTPKAFDLLAILAEHRGSVVTKETLMASLWPDTTVEESNLTFQVSALRKALGGDSRTIATIPGRGYQLAEPVTELVPVGSTQTERAAGTSTVVQEEERTTITIAEDDRPRPSIVPLVGAIVLFFMAATMWMARQGADTPAAAPAAKSAAPAVRSVAILPFKPIGTKRDEALELGMADTLITRLSHLPGISIAPTSAVRRFDGLDHDPIAAGKQLGADIVLDGSIQRADGKIRMNVRLLRTADGRPMWSEQFDQPAGDLFGVQDRVADAVARSIAPALSRPEQKFVAKRTTSDLVAYDLYVEGVYWRERNPGRAEALFRRAAAQDPRFAAAWAGAARSAMLQGRFIDRNPGANYERAREAAAHALAVDSELAEGHAALASIAADYDWNLALADAAFEKAVELNPNSSDVRIDYAFHLLFRRRFDDAIAQARRAQELDPLSSMAAATTGMAYRVSGRTSEAIRLLTDAAGAFPPPQAVPIRLHLALALVAEGRAPEGVEIFRSLQQSGGDHSQIRSLLAYSLARAGQHEEALKMVKEEEARSVDKPVAAPNLALAYVALGDHDRALYWLEKAHANRIPLLRVINMDRGYDPIRADPRFKALLAKMGNP